MDEEAAAVLPNPAEVDDDFSPQDAFNLFTPSIYRPGAKDRPDIDPFDVLVPPGSLGGDPGDGFTFDSPLSAVTLSAVGGGSKSVAGSGINGPLFRTFNSTLTQLVPPDVGAPENDGWIFGELEDTILLPVVLATIGLFAVLGNSLLLLTLAGLRRMRSGPNLMLANVALADLVFVAVTVPTAVVNHVTRAYYFISTGDDVIGPRVCRFVYYVIFVTVYVSVYTLVVSSVFRFFGELIRGNSAAPNAPGKRTDEDMSIAGIQARSLNPPVVVCSTGKTVNDGGLQIESGNSESNHHSVPLSACSAVVSCAVVWVAFAASHLTFVIQSDVSGLAAFEKPIVCVYSVPDIPGGGGPSGSSGNDATVADPSRVRTLWITFLACAFLLPLAIVCCSSAAVLKIQRRTRRRRYQQRVGARDESVGSRLYSSAACSSLAPAAGDDTNEQNAANDGRAKREMTTVIMASTVARAVCWLPLQIFILLDIFGPEPEADTTGDLYQKLEMIGICMALVGACVGPPICRIVSSEFRDAFRLVARRVFCCCRRRRREPPYVSSRLIVREPPPLHTVSASSAATAAATAPYLHRQLSRQATPMLPCCEHDLRQPLQQQHTQQHHMTAIKNQLMYRPDLGQLVPGSTSVSGSGRQSASDMNETILSIISDSSNHINYA